jgi:excisionase family DNA binding protein
VQRRPPVYRQRVPVTPTTPYDDLPQFLSVKEAAVYTQQWEGTIRQGIRVGTIPSKRFGVKCILIPKEAFRVDVGPAAVGA